MKRRAFIGLVGGVAAWPLAARAQQSAKVLRVGTANVQPRTAPQWMAFVRRIADLGYREGENFVFDHIQIPNAEAWETGYREVVARKPDIILAAGPERSLKAAVAVASGLPIVTVAVDYDPVSKGLVQSLSRPSGSITGVYFQNVELVGKRVELMKQALPNVSTMTAFWDGASGDFLTALKAVAAQFGMQLNLFEFRERPYEYGRVFANAAAGDGILYAGGSPFFFLDRARLAEFAIQHHMAWLCELRENAAAGGLMSYGPSLTGMFALAAGYVDRIARGAKPSDLPIQQPTKFEFVINLRTAKALGVDIPSSLLATADEVIE
jgi:putative ABC transport system substrate-binding protein